MRLVGTDHRHRTASSLTFRKPHFLTSLSHPSNSSSVCHNSDAHHLAVMIIPSCGCEHITHEDAGARTSSQLHSRLQLQSEIACILFSSLFLSFLPPPSFTAQNKKAESCSRCVVMCQLNTFQEELLKFKIF